jgi:hypothetical protein
MQKLFPFDWRHGLCLQRGAYGLRDRIPPVYVKGWKFFPTKNIISIFRVKKEESKSVKIFGTDLMELYNATNERGDTIVNRVLFTRTYVKQAQQPRNICFGF